MAGLVVVPLSNPMDAHHYCHCFDEFELPPLCLDRLNVVCLGTPSTEPVQLNWAVDALALGMNEGHVLVALSSLLVLV